MSVYIKNQHKRILAKHVTDAGLQINDFTTTEEEKKFSIAARRVPTSFLICPDDEIMSGDGYTVMVSDRDQMSIYKSGQHWNQVEAEFLNWVYDIKGEMNPKTGWESSSDDFLNVGGGSVDRLFSPPEQQQARSAINDIKASVSTLGLQSSDITIINAKLDQLYEKVDQLSAFDWKSQAVGTFINLVFFLVMPPETAGTFWSCIKTAFKGLFKIE